MPVAAPGCENQKYSGCCQISWGQNHSPLRTPYSGQSLLVSFSAPAIDLDEKSMLVVLENVPRSEFVCCLIVVFGWFLSLSHAFCKLDINDETLLGLSSPFGKGIL